MDAELYALSFLSRNAKKQFRESPHELIDRLGQIPLFKRRKWKFRTKKSKKSQSVRYIFESDSSLTITLYKSCVVLKFYYLNEDIFHKDKASEYEDFGSNYEYRADILSIIRLFGGDEIIFASRTPHSGSDILIKMAKGGSSYREVKSFITENNFLLTKNLHKVFHNYFSPDKTREFIYDDFEVVKNPKFIDHKENIKKTESIGELIYTGNKLIKLRKYPTDAFKYIYEAEKRLLLKCADRTYFDAPEMLNWESLNEFYSEYNKKNGAFHYFAFTEAYWDDLFNGIESGLYALTYTGDWEYLSLLFSNLQFRQKFNRFYWQNKVKLDADKSFRK